mmetsp:Transcript_14141/g.30238  ORF Transcript_14141/g.30238 Transcript_14141/m.30238 type:complete len:209 (-) Transcript_14141:305-931(-)
MDQCMIVKHGHIPIPPLNARRIGGSIHIGMKNVRHELPRLLRAPSLESIESHGREIHALAFRVLVPAHERSDYLVLLAGIWKRTQTREPIRCQLEIEQRIQIVIINALQLIHRLLQLRREHGVCHFHIGVDRVATTVLRTFQKVKCAHHIRNLGLLRSHEVRVPDTSPAELIAQFLLPSCGLFATRCDVGCIRLPAKRMQYISLLDGI